MLKVKPCIEACSLLIFIGGRPAGHYDAGVLPLTLYHKLGDSPWVIGCDDSHTASMAEGRAQRRLFSGEGTGLNA